MKPAEFEVTDLQKSYLKQPALQGISLRIEQGSMNFLLGSNGSGKSTLIKCLAGHQYWENGDILRRGYSRKDDSEGYNSGIHFISEDISPPRVSLGELREFYRATYGAWDNELFTRLVSWGDLKLNQTLNQVSRGQRVQGLLALSLSAKPEVLLIDEATAVLDPFIRNRLMMELERINRETGMTVLIATNIATEVAVLKGRLLIMQGGKLVIDRSAEKMSEGFIKIRVSANEIDETQNSGFSFLERNQDGSYSFLGRAETLPALSASYLVDQRSITIDELFIFFSERRTA